jgi:hypothetical protein
MSYSPLGILSLVKPTIPSVPTTLTTTVKTSTVPVTLTINPVVTTVPLTQRAASQDPPELLSPILLPSYTPPEAQVVVPIARESTINPVVTAIPAVPVLSLLPALPVTSASAPVPITSSVPVLSSQGSVPMDRRQAVSYLQTLLATSSTNMLEKAGTVCSNTKDSVICAQRIVSEPTSAWRVEYKRLLKEIYASYGKTELDALYSFVYGTVKTKTGMGDDWLSMYLNPDYQALTRTLTSAAKTTIEAPMTTPSTTVSRVLTNPANLARVIRPSTTEAPITSTPTTSYTPPVDRPDGGVEMSSSTNAFDMAETRSYENYQYRAIPSASEGAAVAILGLVTKSGTVDFGGKTWTKLDVLTPPPSGAVMGGAVYDEIMSSGKGVLIAKDASSTTSMFMLGTDDIAEVSDLTMNNESIVLLSEPVGGWKKPMSKAVIYGGIAVAAVAGIGLIYYMTRK